MPCIYKLDNLTKWLGPASKTADGLTNKAIWVFVSQHLLDWLNDYNHLSRKNDQICLANKMLWLINKP